ncbi:hypothetical protein [Sphingorhabdus sp. SMR4y]|uniref:hypothetical protein n=1 Tax=Sphingorhabdus sp. SMR4y TaxID=2584094 RepID=UPI0016414A4E|nr:hypothetical protein [Sphingorhabdus sp. SMR4y]
MNYKSQIAPSQTVTCGKRVYQKPELVLLSDTASAEGKDYAPFESTFIGTSGPS